MSDHVVLLGDSIFDNAVYVPNGPSVMDHLCKILPSSYEATLLAVDGDVVSSVFRQIERIPADASHLILSVGGNDALSMAGDIFSQPADGVRQSLEHVAEVCCQFRVEYQRLMDELQKFRLPLAICTIYDAVPGLGSSEVAGLCFFNDTITRTAFQAGATLIDLRTICSDVLDYSPLSPIEPSAQGGEKVARAIWRAIDPHSNVGRVVA